MLKKQIVNFVVVGFINTIFGYSIYALFIYAGFNYILSTLFATILGVLFNFKTIGKFVFNSHNNNLVIKFFMVYIFIFGINVMIIKLVKTFGYNDYISGLVALVPSAIMSFVLNKFFVFKSKL